MALMRLSRSLALCFMPENHELAVALVVRARSDIAHCRERTAMAPISLEHLAGDDAIAGVTGSSEPDDRGTESGD